MTSGSVFISARTIFKLHNLYIPLRLISTAPVTTSTEVVLDELAVQLVHKKPKKWRGHTYESEKSYVNNVIYTKGFDKKNEIVQPPVHNIGEETYVSNTSSKCQHDVLLNSKESISKLLTTYSKSGSVENVIFLKEYARSRYQDVYLLNGEFDHFLAQAYCFRGNSQKGLSLLSKAYRENKNLRNCYRIIFRDLIKDSVTNKSVASLMTFKNFVVMWSEELNENYPLVCLWHCCWSSSWYSDHKFAEELIEKHEPLRIIVADRASALTFSALGNTKEDDAAVRLMQTLLKYEMMDAYEQALQILFEFRLKNGDRRGCKEILQNTETLGLKLSQKLQNRYVHMIINRGITPEFRPVKRNTNIKFKF